ncbi:MAG: DHH family phosphoesterase [Methanomassiliicoccaceae archaeon]|nr:DHH family phosphoesterase [Methanomassiliicoccaceae archaeon]
MDDGVLKLLSSLSSATDVVRKHDDIHIFSHHDADGISAGVILSRTVMRAGKSFKLTLLGALNNVTIDEVRNCGAGCVMIADMGASYLRELDGMDADVVILDHHRDDGYECVHAHYVNPHSFGIDGMTEGCGASVAMLFSARFDEDNWDLVQTAFAGIVGDKQHLKGLGRINEYLFTEGNRRRYVTMTDGSLIPPGHLISSLFLSSDPYIRGVSGDADGVTAILGDAGIDISRSSADLSDAERRKLSSLIAARLIAQDVSKETLEETSSVRFALRDWSIGAAEIASILDSCGRSGIGGAGAGFAMGDRKCFSEATAADEDARRRIVTAARDLDSNGIRPMGNIQSFDCTSSGFTGILCDIVMRFIGDRNKPVIGLNRSDGMTKASARCSHSLLRKGVDLSSAMKKAGESVGGGGGGHMIASGAWFPPGKEEEFLEITDRIIGEQISAR